MSSWITCKPKDNRQGHQNNVGTAVQCQYLQKSLPNTLCMRSWAVTCYREGYLPDPNFKKEKVDKQQIINSADTNEKHLKSRACKYWERAIFSLQGNREKQEDYLDAPCFRARFLLATWISLVQQEKNDEQIGFQSSVKQNSVQRAHDVNLLMIKGVQIQ